MSIVEITGKFLDFKLYASKVKKFVETGTGRLDGVLAAIEAGFKEIKTVEACRKYFEQNMSDMKQRHGFHLVAKSDHCVQCTRDDIIVEMYFGMSQDCLDDMLKTEKEPVVLWLDAHVSGPNSAGHEDYLEKGNESKYAQNTVLMSELEIICKQAINNHIVLIDDQHGLSDENKKYMETLSKRNPNYMYKLYDEKRGADVYKNKTLACIPAAFSFFVV